MAHVSLQCHGLAEVHQEVDVVEEGNLLVVDNAQLVAVIALRDGDVARRDVAVVCVLHAQLVRQVSLNLVQRLAISILRGFLIHGFHHTHVLEVRRNQFHRHVAEKSNDHEDDQKTDQGHTSLLRFHRMSFENGNAAGR